MKWMKDGCILTDEKEFVDLDAVHAMLSRTYWAKGRPKETVKATIEASLCFTLLREGRQIGFTRVLSDFAVYAILLDVVVMGDARGQGLGKWMVKSVMEHPAIASLNKMLWTRDGDDFYSQAGFSERKDLKLMACGSSGVQVLP
ncbi:MAG: GNAT family N-acetyltransferase [Deltaproteobacteria bacterium]|nr:GNAT family N-acetyltransferase [Deltaproteobacteria bacterium]